MTAPADSVDIAVAGDPARARDTIAGALAARGFALSWSDDWNGLATRGSKTKQVFLGTFALYLEVAVSVFVANGNVIVRLSRPSTGMTGGLAGRAKARNQFASLTTEVTEVFRANGVLLPPPL
jgi:hypothetical protein